MNLTGDAFAARSRVYTALATTLDAGLPLASALEGAAVRGAAWKDVGPDLARRIAGGQSLAQAVGARNDVFSSVEIRLIDAGERSGRLPEAFSRLAHRYERLAANRRALIWGLAYPALLLHAAVVLPSLPLVVHHGLAGFIGDGVPKLLSLYAAVFGLWFLVTFLARRPAGLSLPLVGEWLRQRAVADYAFVLGALISAGGSLPSALRFAAESLDHPTLRAAGLRVARRVERGSGLGAAFASVGQVFDVLFIEQVKVGEVAGRLEPGLAKAEEIAHDELERQTKRGLVTLTVACFLFAALLIAWQVIGFWTGYAETLNVG